MATSSRTSPISTGDLELSLPIVAWSLAVAAYGIGDTGSTIVLLELGGSEGAALARWFLETAGYLGLVIQKALVLALCVAVYLYYPTVAGLDRDPWRLVVPVVMIVKGVALLANNLGVIGTLLGA